MGGHNFFSPVGRLAHPAEAFGTAELEGTVSSSAGELGLLPLSRLGNLTCMLQDALAHSVPEILSGIRILCHFWHNSVPSTVSSPSGDELATSRD